MKIVKPIIYSLITYVVLVGIGLRLFYLNSVFFIPISIINIPYLLLTGIFWRIFLITGLWNWLWDNFGLNVVGLTQSLFVFFTVFLAIYYFYHFNKEKLRLPENKEKLRTLRNWFIIVLLIMILFSANIFINSYNFVLDRKQSAHIINYEYYKSHLIDMPNRSDRASVLYILSLISFLFLFVRSIRLLKNKIFLLSFLELIASFVLLVGGAYFSAGGLWPVGAAVFLLSGSIFVVFILVWLVCFGYYKQKSIISETEKIQ